jgi:hypothetical protein
MQHFSKEMDDIISREEIARRNRWRKGIERGWKDDDDIPSLLSNVEDESVLTGCRSHFSGGESSTAGFTSCTGFTGATHTTTCSNTTGGYFTDVTDESDDSEITFRSYPYDHLSLRQARNVAPRRYIQEPSSRYEDSLLAGVAEDLGILAGFFISDGHACVGGVADITRESIKSCKPEI